MKKSGISDVGNSQGKAGRGRRPVMAEGGKKVGQDEVKVEGQVWVTISMTVFIWEFLKISFISFTTTNSEHEALF